MTLRDFRLSLANAPGLEGGLLPIMRHGASGAPPPGEAGLAGSADGAPVESSTSNQVRLTGHVLPGSDANFIRIGSVTGSRLGTVVTLPRAQVRMVASESGSMAIVGVSPRSAISVSVTMSAGDLVSAVQNGFLESGLLADYLGSGEAQQPGLEQTDIVSDSSVAAEETNKLWDEGYDRGPQKPLLDPWEPPPPLPSPWDPLNPLDPPVTPPDHKFKFIDDNPLPPPRMPPRPWPPEDDPFGHP